MFFEILIFAWIFTRLPPPKKPGGPQYDNTNIYSITLINAARAKFVMKINSGATERLTILTGSHMSLVGYSLKK